MMQALEHALLMLADRGEDLPADVLVARLETALDVAADPDRAPAWPGGRDLDRIGRSGASGGRRVPRPAVAVAVAAVVVLVVVAAATLMLGRVGVDDVPPVDTTIVDGGLHEVLRVAFDGSACSVDGPASISAATVVPVVLTNTSGNPAQAHVARLEQGHIVTGEERTFDDFAELQQEAGGVFWDDVDNLIDSPANWLRPEPLSFDGSAYRLARTLADNESLKVYQLSPELGRLVVFVTRTGPFDPEHRVNPEGYWFCSPLEVIAVEF